MNRLYAWSCVAILQPALLNDPPQFIAETELIRLFWLQRSIPLQDRVNGQNVRLKLDVGVVSA